MASSSPAQRFGALFEQVQMRRLFTDGKIFADAVPRRPADAILAAYRAAPDMDDAALKRFVLAHFDLPDEPAPPPQAPADQPLRTHIRDLWDTLTRPALQPAEGSSALALPRPYVVPGGRFRELYYWDSYFTMLGLAADGRRDLVEDMIDNFTRLIERYGHVPNGARTYYLSRSQPPVYTLMLGLSSEAPRPVLRRRLAAMMREHAFWMRGATDLDPGEAGLRVVRMPDGAILNRYWDDRAEPRDEAWREDVLTAEASGRPAAEVYRDLRAAAESGWDFCSRWLGPDGGLASIRTTAIVPLDLNCLLHMAEAAIARVCLELGEPEGAARFEAAAQARRQAIDRHLWRTGEGRYADHDRVSGRPTDCVSAAIFFPLFAGIADPARAQATADLAERLLVAPGGVRTTTRISGQQWDAPNGWAPLQWVAAAGLRRYGHHALADRIAAAWLAMVEAHYRRTGGLLEKYDVEQGAAGAGGEYPVQQGFGWTNGVTAALWPMAWKGCR